MLKKIFFLILLFFTTVIAFAQEPAMQDSVTVQQRQHESLYVVFGVCLTILIILFLYLLRLERTIAKLEKK